MGGSHRTTDMSLTANKGRGRNDGKAVGRGKKRENNREREKRNYNGTYFQQGGDAHLSSIIETFTAPK